jgi:hypothetical protein
MCGGAAEAAGVINCDGNCHERRDVKGCDRR